MPTIQVRIDQKTKQAAKKVLDKLGIDMSTAVKAYFKQIDIKQGLPFQLTTDNGLTVAEKKALLKASIEAKQGKNVTKHMSADEMVDHLESL